MSIVRVDLKNLTSGIIYKYGTTYVDRFVGWRDVRTKWTPVDPPKRAFVTSGITRHDWIPQSLGILSADTVVLVSNSDDPDPSTFQAVLVPSGIGVILKPRIWYSSPILTPPYVGTVDVPTGKLHYDPYKDDSVIFQVPLEI